MIQQLLERLQPLLDNEMFWKIGPWVVAAICFTVAGILFIFVRVALIKRGHSPLTGTCNLYFYNELNEYYEYVAAESRSTWLYHTIRILAVIGYISIAIFIIGVFRNCQATQEKMDAAPGGMRFDAMELIE